MTFQPRGNPAANDDDKRHEPKAAYRRLVLTELPPGAVFDSGRTARPAGVLASGNVRETCPRCGTHLQLVLRQELVRLAHLFCTQCGHCYDARYPNGRCALTP